MDTVQNINAFVRVARLGSFSAAARDLGAAPSVITKRISQLEKKLGLRLINRSTRGLALTADGERVLSRFVRLLAQHDEIFCGSSVRRDRVEGMIRIQTPPTITSMFLGEILIEFQERHPRVDMEIILMERCVNPLEEGFDMVFGAWPISYPNVLDVTLCPYELVPVCAPSYLKAHPAPTHPTELVDHQCLTTVLFRTSWAFTHSQGSMNVEVHSRLQSSDARTIRDAALRGMGITVLPRFLIKEDLKAGALVRVLEGFSVTQYWLKVMVPRMKMNRPAMRELVEFLKARMQPAPPWGA
jgi:DNA-binding transcriptional LysR family regulator